MHKILTTLFFTAVVAVGGLSIPANAQITTGEPTSKVIRTGNRASAGDFGLYLGLTSTMVGDMFDGSVKLSALPLINLKYMMTDKAEWRLGLELYKTSSRNEGVISQTWEDNMYDLPLTSRNSSSNAMFYPGFAWHFSSKNILDVYVGAELPIGWDSSTEYSEYGELDIFENPSLPNVLDVKKILSTNKVTKRSFVIGFGAFIGLQAYIADLPLALGLELGISSRFDTGLKYKHEITNTGSEDQIYYTTSLDSDVSYDK